MIIFDLSSRSRVWAIVVNGCWGLFRCSFLFGYLLLLTYWPLTSQLFNAYLTSQLLLTLLVHCVSFNDPLFATSLLPDCYCGLLLVHCLSFWFIVYPSVYPSIYYFCSLFIQLLLDCFNCSFCLVVDCYCFWYCFPLLLTIGYYFNVRLLFGY